MNLLVDDLTDQGFDVVSAENGASALGQIFRERPDLVLLDLNMPVIDGLEVLRTLRKDANTQNLPVIFLTAVSPDEAEHTAMQIGANHYVTKPWEPGTLRAVIRVALRESENAGGAFGATSGFVTTGNQLLDNKLGGGVPVSGLTLIEGGTSTGKSVLCQHFACAAFLNGYGVAYFTTQYAPSSLISQMGSLGLDPSKHYRDGSFRITQLREIDPSMKSLNLLEALMQHIKELPDQFRYIIVDAVTSLVNLEDETEVQTFFTSCKKMGDDDKSFFLSIDPIGLTEDTLYRVRAKSDGYFALRLEKIGPRLSNILEVCKVRNAEELTGNIVSFDVEPGLGIKLDATRRTQ